MTSQTDALSGLLQPGENCWRVEQASRVAFLMENDAYFDALSLALAQARRSVVVLGWQFDPRTRLDPDHSIDDRQAEIGHQLRLMVKTRPELDVRLLIWKSPLLIAASQGFFPHRAQAWFRRRFVELRLDSPPMIGACHHQKVVVIDDALAFCGGGDISTDRWDSCDHLDGDPRRAQPNGLICSPRHEVMCMMDGAAARALGDLARERWRRATWERTLPVQVDHDPWPESITPDLTDVPIGIARTEPGVRGQLEVRENEHLHLDAIARAKRLIYMENQYFTSPAITDALSRRLAEPDGPEVVLVTTGSSPSWFDRLTMDTARAQVLFRLEQADHHDRFLAFAPYTPGGERIIVHAKMTIIDDELIRIGSTNLNNRSMGFDTECDVMAAPGPSGREAVSAFRYRSLAHFLGVSPEVYKGAEAEAGSVGVAVQSLAGKRMHILGSAPPTGLDKTMADWQVGDPVSPADAFRPWRRRFHARRLPPPVPDEPDVPEQD